MQDHTPTTRAHRWLLCLALPLLACWQTPRATPSQAPEVQAATGPRAEAAAREQHLDRLLERVVVLGASAADGFGLPFELGGRDRSLADFYRLASVSTEATRADPAKQPTPPLDLANNLLFTNAQVLASEQIERALAYQPSLVLGADFLFWFVYGPRPESQRAAFLEQGLALLERLLATGAILAVADVPFMESASLLMLPRGLRASEASVAAANLRIAAWARGRPRLCLIPLAQLMEQIAAGETIAGPGWSLADSATEALLQPDGLHPSVLGTAVLLAIAMDRVLATACLDAELDRRGLAPGTDRTNPGASAGDRAAPAPTEAELAPWRAALARRLELTPQRLAERVLAAAPTAPPQAQEPGTAGEPGPD